jgi:phosphohistidine phosphatase
MRHGEASKTGGEIASDADRILTEYGRMQATTIAEELKRRQVCPRIVSSPFRRAVQTAEILAEILGSEPAVTDAELSASGRAPDLEALLKRHSATESVLFLGHQPDVGMLVERLIGFELGFGTANLSAFESRPEEKWRYLWTLVPEDLFQK